jgi:phospholipid transport system substrate-binding protein
MSKMTKLSTLLVAGLLCGTPVGGAFAFDGLQPPFTERLALHVDQLSGSKSFIDGMAKTAIGFLGDTNLNEEQRKQEFRKLLHTSFDMKTIGRFALGTNWKTATPAQQAEYLKLFESMVVEVYANRFSEYDNQALEVAEAAPEGKDVMVTSYIVPEGGGDKFRVDWRVRNKEGGYKIVDVIVEGVSMALTQRSDFASVIQRGGGNLEVLLEHLRK